MATTTEYLAHYRTPDKDDIKNEQWFRSFSLTKLRIRYERVTENVGRSLSIWKNVKKEERLGNHEN